MALEQLHSTSYAQTDNDYDIAIVGGGIVGATLAAALKDSGLKTAIIEAKPLEVGLARNQAYAITVLSSLIYEGMGVWDQILPHIAKFRRIHLSDSDRAGVVFQTGDLDRDYLGYVAEHRVLLSALQKTVTQCSHISWLCPAEVVAVEYSEDARLIISMAGGKRQLRAKLVVGADGARSQIRTSAGIRTRGWKYWQSCVATTIRHQSPENATAFERFWSTGPMGVLPLPENRCQVVWTNPHDEAKALQALDEREFLAKLEHYTGGLLGRLELAGDRVVFPVQLMQSDRYVKPRLALVGDAAHCCHPVGGQGLNLGIRDAAALAQVLQEAYQREQDIGDIGVLRRYERWRKRENLAILGFTDILDRTFSNNWLPVVASRRLGLWAMRSVPPVKVFALQLMTGLKGRTPQLAQAATK